MNAPPVPTCAGCKRGPLETHGPLVKPGCTAAEAVEYVLTEEGTLNKTNGHYLCDPCYIKAGMPSSPKGWVCP